MELRSAFGSELEQLRLQVELMALKVDTALERANRVLETGDRGLADVVIKADDEIDAMLVSLTERCYDLLCRQNPMASDLRFVVSVLRILADLERTGDLCLRLVKLAPDQPLMARNPETFQILKEMGAEARDLFQIAVQAWAAQDLRSAQTLEGRDDFLDAQNARLLEAIVKLRGEDAVAVAIATVLAGRAFERIADHAVMVGERLRYMLTGDLHSLTREIGP